MYDSRDYNYTAGIISGIGNRVGEIYWEMTPGTAPASANAMYVGEWVAVGSTTSFMRVYFSGASSVTLQYADGKGHTGTGALNVTASLASGTSYQCKLYYQPGEIGFVIDNSSTASITIAGDVDWGQDPPVLAYWGGNSSAGANGVYTNTTFSRPTMDTYRY